MNTFFDYRLYTLVLIQKYREIPSKSTKTSPQKSFLTRLITRLVLSIPVALDQKANEAFACYFDKIYYRGNLSIRKPSGIMSSKTTETSQFNHPINHARIQTTKWTRKKVQNEILTFLKSYFLQGISNNFQRHNSENMSYKQQIVVFSLRKGKKKTHYS